ncbi:hypothetical protein CC86DRAFT_454231 [Ophiobolus disseminans]|uniref:Interferon-induced GTP-binding protein Mx2 n=1 Tax=Ophiobolus disseminans TaxID=1469910 RepID=A0A6A7A756_9PLEO|nr:hypothetical protein CC86DRAFT_454231 [Ophiobolus disseminans]
MLGLAHIKWSCRSNIAYNIDRLRELNVSSIELPQIVVVGDQSSGKSSVLESLTGFAFPQAPGLCTRYATQISCRRESESSVKVSIIPSPGCDAAWAEELRKFERTMLELSNGTLADIMREANGRMRIKMTRDEKDANLQAFSQHILKVEINGPDQEHFTVIDVPGIFRNPDLGMTTESDISLVRNMVETYMRNSRTVILVVLASNVDPATQSVLQMATIADPKGSRTMGVLTKPDLVTENVTRDVIKDLVLDRRNKLQLGYCLVKNRSADDQSSTLADRLAQEEAFFNGREWRQVSGSGRCGTSSLKIRLKNLLLTISKREFPNVRAGIAQRLDQSRNELRNLGPARKEHAAQRQFLGQLGSEFQEITQCALNGSYNDKKVFENDRDFKLIITITKMNERFANTVWKKGHKRHISPTWNNEGESSYEVAEGGANQEAYQRVLSGFPELCEFVDEEDYECPKPKAFTEDSITDHVESVFQENRGPELGTFPGSILAMTFKEQSEKWEPVVLAHVSKSIMIVHTYIAKLVAHICPDTQVRTQLWEILLVEELQKAYIRAMEHARFLLRIERDGTPTTYNHYFNSEVQKKRLERWNAAATEQAATLYTESNSRGQARLAIPLGNFQNFVTNKDNVQHVREDLLDVLVSYYKVSRKRFVDVICRQVIGHFLLDGEQSPLKVFSSQLVMGLGDDVLESIAGEEQATKYRRAWLEAEIESLEAAMKVLRG